MLGRSVYLDTHQSLITLLLPHRFPLFFGARSPRRKQRQSGRLNCILMSGSSSRSLPFFFPTICHSPLGLGALEESRGKVLSRQTSPGTFFGVSSFLSSSSSSFVASSVCTSLSRGEVTNDHAERGVALTQEAAQSGRFENEEQLQYALQVIEQNRAEFGKNSDQGGYDPVITQSFIFAHRRSESLSSSHLEVAVTGSQHP